MATICSHMGAVERLSSEVFVCEDCVRIGSWWVHLRMCATCGHVGCCDQSPNKHATQHFQSTGHPIIRSQERSEDWMWCYVDEVFLEVPETVPVQAHT